MDKFLIQSILKLTKKETENINNYRSIEEIEVIFYKLVMKNTPSQIPIVQIASWLQ